MGIINSNIGPGGPGPGAGLSSLADAGINMIGQNWMEQMRNEAEMNKLSRAQEYTQQNMQTQADLNVKTAKAEAQAKVDIMTNPANVAAEVSRLSALSKPEAQAAADKIAAEISAKSTPAALQALKNITMATQDPSKAALEGAQTAALTFANKQNKIITDIRSDLADAVQKKDAAATADLYAKLNIFAPQPEKEVAVVNGLKAIIGDLTSTEADKAAAKQDIFSLTHAFMGRIGAESAPAKAPSPGDIQRLLSGAGTDAQFDQVYGQGAAAAAKVVAKHAPATPAAQPGQRVGANGSLVDQIPR